MPASPHQGPKPSSAYQKVPQGRFLQLWCFGQFPKEILPLPSGKAATDLSLIHQPALMLFTQQKRTYGLFAPHRDTTDILVFGAIGTQLDTHSTETDCYNSTGRCQGRYNLSYKSRNEPHFARRGGLYYPLKLDGQIEKLYDKIKRWSFKGRPTRKVQKLRALEQRMEQGFSVSNMLLKRQGIGGNK